MGRENVRYPWRRTLFSSLQSFLGWHCLRFALCANPKSNPGPETLSVIWKLELFGQRQRNLERRNLERRNLSWTTAATVNRTEQVSSDEITASGTKLQHDPYKHW